MTRTSMWILPGVIAVGLIAGCQTDYLSHGSQGEACRIDADCAGGLSCVAFVCVEELDPVDVGVRDTGDRDTDDRDTSDDTRVDVRPDTTPDVPLPDVDDTCSPGERLCGDPGTVWLCRPDGSGYLFRRCAADQVCQDGQCVTETMPICDPGARRCQGSVVERCRPDGQRWDAVEDCRAIEAQCVRGACQSDVSDINIRVDSVDVDGGGVPGGIQLYLWGVIVNTGRAAVGPVDCSAWLSLDTSLQPQRDIWLWGETFFFDGRGSEGFETEVWTVEAQPGRYRVILECDVLTQRWLETDESDNIAVGSNVIVVDDVVTECTEDGFEGLMFPTIEPGGYVLGLCRDDVDTFTFDNPTDGATLTGFANPWVPGTVWSITIWSLDSGEFVFESTNDGALELFAVLRRGSYGIEIRRDTGPTNYDLAFELEGAVVTDLPDLVPEGFNVFPGGPLPGSPIFGDYTIFNGGRRRSGETEVTIWLSRDQRRSDDDLVIWREFVPTLTPGEGVGFGFDAFVDEGLADGVYWPILFVDSPNFVRESNERNNVMVGPAVEVRGGTTTECGDVFEPNDSFNRARPIEPGFFSDLTVCDNNRDFYRVCLGDNQLMTVDLYFRHSVGDIDVNILDDDGQQVAGAYGVDNTEHVEVDVGAGRCFTVDVYLCCGGGPSTYDMEIGIFDVPPDEVCTLSLEPNDDRSQAASLLRALALDDLALCPRFDTDVYFLDAQAGQTINVSALNQSPNIQLQMAVYSGNEYVGDSFALNPSVTFRARTTGRYFIELRRTEDSQRTVRYRMSMTEF